MPRGQGQGNGANPNAMCCSSTMPPLYCSTYAISRQVAGDRARPRGGNLQCKVFLSTMLPLYCSPYTKSRHVARDKGYVKQGAGTCEAAARIWPASPAMPLPSTSATLLRLPCPPATAESQAGRCLNWQPLNHSWEQALPCCRALGVPQARSVAWTRKEFSLSCLWDCQRKKHGLDIVFGHGMECSLSCL